LIFLYVEAPGGLRSILMLLLESVRSAKS